MIRKRSLLIKGLIFLLAVFILNIPFPNSAPLINSVFSFLGLPIYGNEETMTGFYYANNAWAIILLISLFLLYKSLNRHRLKLTILAAFIVTSGPGFMIEVMQKTVLSGMYAVSYDAENSNCTFETNKRETILTGNCKLSFENNRSKPVTFEVAIDKRAFFEDEQPFLQMMNKPKLHTITLESKGYQTVEITSYVKVADLPSKLYIGEMNGFHINIYQNGKKRYL
ncbi:hypothetical protein [Priestia aryabhattai]|uniref:hypothetical protein n=1 Tax=Priestia aryabhattai TaxID=412384 RepID=UPI00064F0A67|nr:hypothetical protein [Priestia aryabhattai]KML28460.1 hypothetical protein VL11_17220 [Priestia aryabhattai]KMN98663.1 hypothetical protein ABV89_16340 [Priestia aryabhattai]